MPKKQTVAPSEPLLFAQRVLQAIALVPGLSVRRLERLAGLGRGAVQGVIDNRTDNPGALTVRNTARTLGLSMDWLCGLANERPDAEHMAAAVRAAEKRLARRQRVSERETSLAAAA